jgi:hypothetical protein
MSGHPQRRRAAAGKPTVRRAAPWRSWAMGAAAVAALLVLGALARQPSPYTLSAHGNPNLLKAVRTFPSEGSGHVAPGTEIRYQTTPPTSGIHYPTPTAPGFYASPQMAGNLVHSLEHGNVVVYYRPGSLKPADKTALQGWASHYGSPWEGFVVVPNPYPSPPYLVLTAWTHMMVLRYYDPAAVNAFASEYLGRGPENPVR